MRLQEFSNKKLAQYKTAAAADAAKADAAGDVARGHKRFKGINTATKKQFDNDAKLAKLKEFAPSGDDGDGFSEETLKQLAAQWYNGDEDPRVEQTLMSAGWEIGQDEGYDNGGVFVVRAGDDQGDSYISWPSEELAMNEGRKKKNKKTSRSLGRYFFPGYGYYGSGESGEGGGDGGGGESAKPDQQLDELSKDTLKDYMKAQPARIKGPAGLATTNPKKAARIVDPEKGDMRRALTKLKDPAYGQQAVAEDSISAMRRLAGIVPQVPVIVPNGQRQYRHMPTAVQPR